MGLSKSFKKIGKAVLNPVGAGIEKLTGMKQIDQLKMGAGIGLGAGLFRALRGNPTTLSVGGGPPQVIGSASGGMLGGAGNWLAPTMLGVAGDVYSARRLASGQEDANQMNLATAREQMAFQERMSSTAHQREVQDLEAAGLNKVLSANSGASTPVGASPDIQNAAPNYGRVAATAMAVQQMRKDFEEADSRIGMNLGARDVQFAQAEAARNSAKLTAKETEIREQELFRQKQDTDWIRRNPRWFNAKKYGEVIAPFAATGRDLGILYKMMKPGDDRDITETFDSKGEHRRTTIKRKGRR